MATLKMATLMASKQDTTKPYTGNETEIAYAIDKIVDDIEADVSALEDAVALLEPAAIEALELAVDTLETVVGEGVTGLVGDVADLQAFAEGTDVIDDTMIDWGTGANQVSAVDIPIADAINKFTTDNVEAALAQIWADDALDSRNYNAGSIDNEHLAAESIDSDNYIDASIDGEHIAAEAIDSDHYVDASIDGEHIAAEAIDSDHYVDGSIDNEHLAVESVDSDNYVDGSIDGEHIAAEAIDSDHYVDGSIDGAHISAEAIDSDHYVDGSIDSAHIGADQVDSDHYATDSIDDEHINWGTGVGQVSGEDVPLADALNLFATDNVEAALAEAMTDLDAAEEDIVALQAGLLGTLLEETDVGLQVSMPVWLVYNVTVGSADIKIYNANAPYRFEVVSVELQPRGASANGTMKLTNGANDITDTMACAVDKTMVKPTTIDDAYSTIAAGGTLQIVCAGDTIGDTKGLLTIGIIKRATPA